MKIIPEVLSGTCVPTGDPEIPAGDTTADYAS